MLFEARHTHYKGIVYFQVKLGYNFYNLLCVFGEQFSNCDFNITLFIMKETCQLISSERPRLCLTGRIMTFFWY